MVLYVPSVRSPFLWGNIVLLLISLTFFNFIPTWNEPECSRSRCWFRSLRQCFCVETLPRLPSHVNLNRHHGFEFFSMLLYVSDSTILLHQLRVSFSLSSPMISVCSTIRILRLMIDLSCIFATLLVCHSVPKDIVVLYWLIRLLLLRVLNKENFLLAVWLLWMMSGGSSVFAMTVPLEDWTTLVDN